MQQRTLDHVKKTIEAEEGLEAVIETQWANTGKVLAMSGTFDVEFTLQYGFYDGYHDGSLSGPAIDRLIDELGVQSRTYPQTGATIQFVDLADQEIRVEDCTGMRGIALPLEMRKRYLRWYMIHYGEETREFLSAMEDVVAYTVRSRAS